MNKYLQETKLLDFKNEYIDELVKKRGWAKKNDKEKILEIYNYVRDEIKFGYNIDDQISASRVLEDGYGQCNTKGILFMALLRAVEIKCRFHGFTIRKELQKGAITGIWYKIAPSSIVHSWVEVFYNNKWFNIEGFILDLRYLSSLQKQFPSCQTNFCGYGVATKTFKRPEIYWNENNTYIQKEGINNDFGVFDDPDSFFALHKQQLGPLKKLVFRYLTRHLMNKNVSRIREQ